MVANLTTLYKNSRAYDFQTYSYDTELDVIVVKDDTVYASLTSPPPAPFTLPSPTPVAGTFVSTNLSYDIFTISLHTLQEADWQLNVGGRGQFKVSALVQSDLQVGFVAPIQNGQLLNQDIPFTLIASIIEPDNPYSPLSIKGLNLEGNINYHDTPPKGTAPYMRRFFLTEEPLQNLYQAVLQFPSYSSPGTYSLTISVIGKTSAVVTEGTLTIRVEHFPVPRLFSQEATLTTIAPWVRVTYSSGDPILGRFNSITIPNTTGQVTGAIQLQNKDYPDAHISQAKLVGDDGTTQYLTIQQQSKGGFLLIIPTTLAAGHYALTLTLNGSFDGYSGDLDSTQFSLRINTQDAPFANYFLAVFLLVDAGVIGLMILVFLLLSFMYFSGPSPLGECILVASGTVYSFKKLRRKWFVTLIRHTVYSEEVHKLETGEGDPADRETLPSGLVFRFYRGGRIMVRKRNFSTLSWQGLNQSGESPKLSRLRRHQFDTLIYTHTNKLPEKGTYTYTIKSNAKPQS